MNLKILILKIMETYFISVDLSLPIVIIYTYIKAKKTTFRHFIIKLFI